VIDTSTMKRCSKCRLVKALAEFHRDRRQPLGVTPACKMCNRVTGRETYRRHGKSYRPRKLAWERRNRARLAAGRKRRSPEQRAQRLAKRRGWYAANRDRIRAQVSAAAKAHRRRDPERVRAKGRAHYQKHRAKILALQAAAHRRKPKKPARIPQYNWRDPADVRRYNREYYRRNRARVREIATAWAKANAAAIRQSRKKYELAHPLVKRQHTQKRRARLRAAVVGPIDFERICQRDRMRCHLCKRRVSMKTLHFDHVIPLARGGAHAEENIAVSHRACNLKKQAKVLTLF